MSYLSQFRTENRAMARHKLWDSYAWHKAIWNLFPAEEDKERDFLFRLDAMHTHTRLLLLSPTPPFLPQWGEGRTKKVAAKFLRHNVYRFQLKANPTKRLLENGKRVGIYAVNDLRTWIERKGEACGFALSLNHLRIQPPMNEYFIRDGKKGTHNSVDFAGILKVTNQQNFQENFYNGIGSAKGFGFGLLMLQPL